MDVSVGLALMAGVVLAYGLVDYGCRRFFFHKEEFTRRIMRQGGRHDG